MKAYQTITLKQIIVLLVMIIVSYGFGRSQEDINLQLRNGLFYKINSETPYTGHKVAKYPNGQKKWDLIYKDGKPEGIFIIWYENGQKEVEGTCKNGKMDGTVTEWYENGQKKKEIVYQDGKILYMRAWHENGSLYSEHIITFRKSQAYIRQIEGATEQARLDGIKIKKWELIHVKAACTPDYIKVWPTCPGGGTWNFDRDGWVAAKIGNATIYTTNVFKDVEDDIKENISIRKKSEVTSDGLKYRAEDGIHLTKRSKAKADIKSLKLQADIYQLDNGEPISSLKNLCPYYIGYIPKDPWGNDYVVTINEDGTIKISCPNMDSN